MQKSPNGKGTGTVGFANDVVKTTATNKQILIVDGGSSVAMAFTDPNVNPTDTMTVQYGGVKGGTIVDARLVAQPWTVEMPEL